jgi:hypothetical protein
MSVYRFRGPMFGQSCVNCPYWEYQNWSQMQSGSASFFIISLMFLILMFYGLYKRGQIKSRGESQRYTPRRGWDETEKEEVRSRQDGRCNKCGRHPPRWEYHHRDGNRSNDNLRNCEGLCPNCHSVKTHD